MRCFIPNCCNRICAVALQVGAEHNQLQPVGCCRGRSSHQYKSNYKIKATVWVCARTCVGGGCAPCRVGACRWIAIRRVTAVMSYSPNKQICLRATAPDLWSLAGFYLEEIIFVYRTNKTALLATALRALVITWISGQSCHSYSTKLINLYNENRTVTNTDPTSKDGIAAVCWPEF